MTEAGPPLAEDSGAVDQIVKALEKVGIDAPTILYDEGLSLARQGLLGAARDRLRILLCFAPNDGEAHLLLAKVFIAQQNWLEALEQLAAARAARVHVPPNLQTEVETALDGERNTGEATTTTQMKATLAQLQLEKLRTETRELRTDINNDIRRLSRHVRLWFGAACGLAFLASVEGIALYKGDNSPQEVSASAPAAQSPSVWERLPRFPSFPAQPTEATSPMNLPPESSSQPITEIPPAGPSQGPEAKKSFKKRIEKWLSDHGFRFTEEATPATPSEPQPSVNPAPSKGASSKPSPEVLRKRNKEK